ncbi:MAG: DUF6502 family protein [bacterium]|nr:DUF6502 family protein [bacterium]
MAQDNRITDFISTMLRPAIRLALRHSLHLQTLLDLIKALLVEEASDELKRQGDTASISRISAMTGVHRKDIASIKKEADENRPGLSQRRTLSVIQRILNNWQTMPDFRDPSGQPKNLAYFGKNSEFNQLVNSVSSDLNPYSVLFELERSGAAQKTESGLKLMANIENLKTDSISAYELLAKDILSLSEAVEENIGDNSRPMAANLHIRTEYDNIAADHLPEIRDWLLHEGSDLHQRARIFLSHFDRDINPKAPGETFAAKVVLGSFSITEAPPDLATPIINEQQRDKNETENS